LGELGCASIMICQEKREYLARLSHFGLRRLVVTAFMRSNWARGRGLPPHRPDESGHYEPSETVGLDDIHYTESSNRVGLWWSAEFSYPIWVRPTGHEMTQTGCQNSVDQDTPQLFGKKR
jgi:hypothetical protein